MNSSVQKTLVIFKPDAVQRGIVGEILTRFENVGLKVVATKMIAPTREQYYKHYEEIGKMVSRRGEQAFRRTIDYMLQGPVVAMVFEGVEAISLVRKLVGPTEPKSAEPGTIRGDYSHMSFGYADNADEGTPNLIHASSNEKEADQEISHWFNDAEIYDYQSLHEKYTR
jgi:nucleoside-diphosphate kinase